MTDLEALKNLVLAPYILKATALIRVQRKVGGNQFRHSFSTLGILLDYKLYHDSILLKAASLHDFLEELQEATVDEIRGIDFESNKVVELVLEVTRQKGESKIEYLQRVLDKGSENALLVKCADRISNLTDLNLDTHTRQKITDYLNQTEKYVLPIAQKVNRNMVVELTDLVARRREIIRLTEDEKRNR